MLNRGKGRERESNQIVVLCGGGGGSVPMLMILSYKNCSFIIMTNI